MFILYKQKCIKIPKTGDQHHHIEHNIHSGHPDITYHSLKKKFLVCTYQKRLLQGYEFNFYLKKYRHS